MKFLTLVAAVNAVRLTARGPAQDAAAMVVADCDASENGEISKAEAHACINKHMKPGPKRQAEHDMVDQMWDTIDTSGNGEVSVDELAALIRQHMSLAKVMGGPTPADIIDACDQDESGGISLEEAHQCIDAHITEQPDNQEAHDAVNEGFDFVDKDGSGEIDEHELSKAMRDHKKGSKALAMKGKGPSPADIIDACDANSSGGIDIDEAHACIDAHITDPDENAQAHAMVDEGFAMVDKNGDGEIDEHELSKALRAHKALAKVKKGPTAKEIIGFCDQDDYKMLSLSEIHDCIDAHPPSPEAASQAKEFVDAVFDTVDTSGDGNISEKELRQAMQAQKDLAQRRRH